jgi:hypothetical protein
MKVGCYCFGQSCFGNKSGIGCWRCVELAREKGDDPPEVEPSLCWFKCEVCLCSCQATFNEDNKQHTIAQSLFKNSNQGEKVSSKSRESKNKEGQSLFFDYLKSSLCNNSVREFWGFDFCSENETVSDCLTKTVINTATNAEIQANANVMQGLQAIIPGHPTTVSVTPADGGMKKVDLSLQQAREEIAGQKGRGGGQRKNPPEQLTVSSDDHTPPASKFVTHVSNHAWRNGLSSVTMNPHQETTATAAAVVVAAVAAAAAARVATVAAPAATVAPMVAANTMMERVKKRVLHMFLNTLNTLPTKKLAAKVHSHIACKDAAFTAVIKGLQDIQPSQEITSACLDLQRAMD